MKYLKVFVDFADKIELLGDAERGRLFTAMLEYASSGAEPDLRGNERFIWPTAKSEIDRQAESYRELCEKNRKNAASRYDSLPLAASRCHSQEEQEQDKDKEQDKEQEENIFPSSNDDVRPSAAGRGAEKAVVDAWNSLGLNPIRSVTPGSTRKQLLSSRINQFGVPAILEAIENVRKSPFLNGQGNHGFTATFDWFLRPSNFQKVLEGNYNNHSTEAPKKAAPARMPQGDDLDRVERILTGIKAQPQKGDDRERLGKMLGVEINERN